MLMRYLLAAASLASMAAGASAGASAVANPFTPKHSDEHIKQELAAKVDYFVHKLSENKHKIFAVLAEKMRERGTMRHYLTTVAAKYGLVRGRRAQDTAQLEALGQELLPVLERAFAGGAPAINDMDAFMTEVKAIICSGTGLRADIVTSLTSLGQTGFSALAPSIGVSAYALPADDVPTVVTDAGRCICSNKWVWSDAVYTELFDAIKELISLGQFDRLLNAIKGALPVIMGSAGVCGSECQTFMNTLLTFSLSLMEGVGSVTLPAALKSSFPENSVSCMCWSHWEWDIMFDTFSTHFGTIFDFSLLSSTSALQWFTATGAIMDYIFGSTMLCGGACPMMMADGSAVFDYALPRVALPIARNQDTSGYWPSNLGAGMSDDLYPTAEEAMDTGVSTAACLCVIGYGTIATKVGTYIGQANNDGVGSAWTDTTAGIINMIEDTTQTVFDGTTASGGFCDSGHCPDMAGKTMSMFARLAHAGLTSSYGGEFTPMDTTFMSVAELQTFANQGPHCFCSYWMPESPGDVFAAIRAQFLPLNPAPARVGAELVAPGACDLCAAGYGITKSMFNHTAGTLCQLVNGTSGTNVTTTVWDWNTAVGDNLRSDLNSQYNCENENSRPPPPPPPPTSAECADPNAGTCPPPPPPPPGVVNQILYYSWLSYTCADVQEYWSGVHTGAYDSIGEDVGAYSPFCYGAQDFWASWSVPDNSGQCCNYETDPTVPTFEVTSFIKQMYTSAALCSSSSCRTVMNLARDIITKATTAPTLCTEANEVTQSELCLGETCIPPGSDGIWPNPIPAGAGCETCLTPLAYKYPLMHFAPDNPTDRDYLTLFAFWSTCFFASECPPADVRGYNLEVSFTVAGTVDSFDATQQDSFKTNLATALTSSKGAVTKEQISLVVSSASINIEATIQVFSPSLKTEVTSQLTNVLSDPAVASSALGVSVTAVSAVSESTSSYPPPAPPPTPGSDPFGLDPAVTGGGAPPSGSGVTCITTGGRTVCTDDVPADLVPIIAGSVGGALAMMVLCCALYCMCKKKKAEAPAAKAAPPPPAQPQPQPQAQMQMVQQPQMMVQQPQMMVQQPGMMVQQPQMMVQQPMMMQQQPMMMQQVPANGIKVGPCGTSNKATDRFCAGCGSNLDAVPVSMPVMSSV